MSEEIESVAYQNAFFVFDYLVSDASRFFHKPVQQLEIIGTSTSQTFGVSGQLLISDIHYSTEFGNHQTKVAMKFYNNEENAMTELKNSILLDIKFKTHPYCATPKVLFASTSNPVMIIYEGIKATNYDESGIYNKAEYAGKLLSAIHGGVYRPVDTQIYQGMARMLGSMIGATGLERQISIGLGRAFAKIEHALSGCDPFSDFHQSNVMVENFGTEEVSRIYIIDPEFMQVGSFDRMEDIGTFFGRQALDEYLTKGNLKQSLVEINSFFKSYEEVMLSSSGITLNQMYPAGCPLNFFIAQWAIMDAVDKNMRLELSFTHPTILNQIKFANFILSNDPFSFPK